MEFQKKRFDKSAVMDCANGDDSGYPPGQNPNVVEKYAKIRKTRVYAVENIVDNVDN